MSAGGQRHCSIIGPVRIRSFPTVVMYILYQTDNQLIEKPTDTDREQENCN